MSPLLLLAILAQPHPCDLPMVAAGTAVIGDVLTVSRCVADTAPDGTVTVQGFAIYVNGARVLTFDPDPAECFRTPLRGTTSAVSGLTLYTWCDQAPIQPGVSTYATAPLTADGEGPMDTPFVLTVTVAPPLPAFEDAPTPINLLLALVERSH